MPFFLFYTDHLRIALWPETDAVSYKLECLTPTELHFRHTFAQPIVIFAANWARFAFQQRRKCQSKFVNATCPVELPLMIPMKTESVILKTYYPSVNIYSVLIGFKCVINMYFLLSVFVRPHANFIWIIYLAKQFI